MAGSRYVSLSPEWITLRERAQALLGTLPAAHVGEAEVHDQLVDTLAVAEAFKAVALQLLKATISSGQTSQRFSAVVKALDFKTPKSALQSFVRDDDATTADNG